MARTTSDAAKRPKLMPPYTAIAMVPFRGMVMVFCLSFVGTKGVEAGSKHLTFAIILDLR